MKELEKAYDSKKYEENIYKEWERSGFFNPDVCIREGVTKPDAPTFSIVLPPPNVTGTLHIGHAVMLAIEDVMIRYHRMKGDRTLWVPGTDHAAIATQEKVEKIMWNDEKKTRHDLGREKFLERVDAFAQDSHDTIVNQAKRMGTSMDWSREYYSLDDTRNLAVRTTFKKMYEDGLVYRGDRIVNWDPKMQSNVSNIEVVRKEEKTKFYYFQYGPFEIGTSRPETKFGDKYVVMHPDDTRYAEYKHGDTFECEWINGPITATVIKDESVDPEFGSGVMTITPWHDATDFEIAGRHDLDKEQVIDFDGKLMDIAGEFAGMPIEEARAKIVEKLDKKGLLTRVDEEYVHQLATNSRGGGVIEPQIMKQWWVSVTNEFTMGESKIDGVKTGEKTSIQKVSQHVVNSNQIEILPNRFKKDYFNWVDNYRDWCISRQLWFGHRIPAWYKKLKTPVDITFIRHAESEANVKKIKSGHKEYPLTEKGKKDATKMAKDFVEDDFDAVFTSDLSRAAETAHIIFSQKDISIKEDARLRAINFGDLTDKSSQEVNKYRISGFPNGETYREVGDRLISFLAEISDKYKKIVIVGHSGIRKMLEHIVHDHPLNYELLTSQTTRETYHYRLEQLQYVGLEAPEGEGWEQDPDTLDTWFSAGLFSFSPLGWPNENAQDLKDYHPTSVLETGYDILTFWVIRMILMSTYVLGEVPFKTVYLHGLVRDEHGNKMSKSLGNIINPLDMCNKYGTDATRLSLLIGATPGNDSRLSEEKIAGYRNFTNKLWNISRYMLLSITDPKQDVEIPESKTLSDKWILHELSEVANHVTESLETYNISSAGESLRDFTWNKLADWYLEIAKVEGAENKQDILNYILNTILKLWHPYMPFVTEAIWQEVYGFGQLMVEKWPTPNYKLDTKLVEQFEMMQEIIVGVRALKSEYNIAPSVKPDLYIITTDKEVHNTLFDMFIHCECEEGHSDVLASLARVEHLTVGMQLGDYKTVSKVIGSLEVHIGADGMIDEEKERARIEKEIGKVEPYVAAQTKKLANKGFTDNAPAEILEGEKKKLEEAQVKLETLQKQLSSLT